MDKHDIIPFKRMVKKVIIEKLHVSHPYLLCNLDGFIEQLRAIFDAMGFLAQKGSQQCYLSIPGAKIKESRRFCKADFSQRSKRFIGDSCPPKADLRVLEGQPSLSKKVPIEPVICRFY